MADRPNILLIMTDQHNKNYIGAYGNEIVRTPNLDRLAREGVRMDAAYCGAPLCVPSRMSFMTSRTPSRNRCWGNFNTLSSGIPTWAHAMSVAGYETALLGRMHFVGMDQRHGFEKRPIGEFHAREPGTSMPGSPTGNHPERWTGQSRNVVEHSGTGTTYYQWMDETITQATCGYLKEHSGEEGRPFAAVIGYMLPHCPFIAPKDLFDYYYDKVDIPEVDDNQPPTVKRFRRQRSVIDPPVADKDIRASRAAYFALCEFVDIQIGKLLQSLEENGLAENTLVIYCSDHGEMIGEKGMWWKSNYYEGGAGVPIIARMPGRIKAGTQSNAVCNLMDLGPTFVDLAGAEPMPDVDGHSMLRVLEGDESDWSNETYSEFIEEKYEADFPSRMIRSGPWKLWQYADAEKLPPVLFNLEEDPDELKDLIDDPNYAAIKEELLAKLHKDWEPERARLESLKAIRAHELISKWGAIHNPESKDVLIPPYDELEKDLEFR